MIRTKKGRMFNRVVERGGGLKKDSDFVDDMYEEDIDNLKSAEMCVEDLVDELSLENEDDNMAWAENVSSPPKQRSPTKAAGTRHTGYGSEILPMRHEESLTPIRIGRTGDTTTTRTSPRRAESNTKDREPKNNDRKEKSFRSKMMEMSENNQSVRVEIGIPNMELYCSC